MRQVSNSADSLVLLGEMVEMASGYADQVEKNSAHDEPFMVRLAHDQLFYLRQRLSKLDKKLKNLMTCSARGFAGNRAPNRGPVKRRKRSPSD